MVLQSRRRICIYAISLIFTTLLVYQTATANELPSPAGNVILAITGNISHTNAPGRAEFDYAMLEELGMVEQRISTAWTVENGLFEGVPSKKVLEFVGATGTRVIAKAINDYSVNIPIEDLTDYSTLLATSLNGERMTIRTRGPIWIVYSNDDRPEASENELNERMIWQLVELEIR